MCRKLLIALALVLGFRSIVGAAPYWEYKWERDEAALNEIRRRADGTAACSTGTTAVEVDGVTAMAVFSVCPTGSAGAQETMAVVTGTGTGTGKTVRLSSTGTAPLPTATSSDEKPPEIKCDAKVFGPVEWVRATMWLAKDNVNTFCNDTFVVSDGTGSTDKTVSKELNPKLDAECKVSATYSLNKNISKQNCKDWLNAMLIKCKYQAVENGEDYFAGGSYSRTGFKATWNFIA